MTQKLKRLIGKADIRVLAAVGMITLFVGLGWTTIQLADESNTVDTWQDVAELFLELRESSYQLAVPAWYMQADQIETIESTYGLAGFAQQPDWFVGFSGELFYSAKSKIGKQIKHGSTFVVYEDMLSGELLIVRKDTGAEEIVFKAPAWPQVSTNESYKNYLYRELSKRRVVWHVTLKEIDQAEAEYAAMLAAMEEESELGGGMMMLLMGGGDELAIAEMNAVTNGLLLNLEYTVSFSGTVWSAYSYDAPACADADTNCVPDPATRFDGLVPPWTLVYSNLVLTGETFTAWTDTRPMAQDEFGNPVNRFYAFGRSDVDTDMDGLSDSFEIFVSKGSAELWDTDGDGVGDALEWANGNSPNNPNDPPNIKGSVSYSGQQTNDIIVLTTADPNDWSIAHSVSIASTGSYQITYAPLGTNYVKAFRDVNGNGFRDTEEAFGVYSNNPVIVTGQVLGINIVLSEPDTDGDKISDYAERTIFRTDPNNAADIPQQLTRSSVECYYGHASGSTNWQLKEGISGLIKSFNVGRGWVTNSMFLPDLSYPNSTIYFGEAIGTTTNNKGGWIYATVTTLDSEVDMGKGWAWNKGFLTDFREASRQVNYFRPKPNAYPDLFVYTHSTNPQKDDMGQGWARPDSFVADLNTSFSSIYQGLVYDFWTSTNMTRTHALPASRTSIHKKGWLGYGWATAAGFVPSTHTFSYYYYGRLKDSRGISGYSISSSDFDFGTYMTLGYGYLAGGDFIPNPSGSEPPISAYDQDGDGFIDIPMASDNQFAAIDDSEFLQLPVTIGDASGSHTEMYGFDIGSFKYDMPFVNSNEYLFTSVVPLERGQTYSGALRSLPDSDTDGDYTFLLGGSIEGPFTNLVYVTAEQLGVIVVANFPHSGTQNTNIFGYVNDSGFNSGSKSFTLHVPRVNIHAHQPGPLNSPGVEITRFREHEPYAVLLPVRDQSAPATLTTNDGYVSKLAVDRFLPTGITSGFLRVTISDTNVLALYDHNNNKMPNNLLYNVATISATNPLYQLKSAARTWHALGLTNGSASVTLSYGLTTNSVLCKDVIQFGVVRVVSLEAYCNKFGASGSFGVNPEIFAGGQTDFGQPDQPPPYWWLPGTYESPSSRVLKVFFKYVKNAQGEPGSFDIDLKANVLPNTAQDDEIKVTWYNWSGPSDSGFLDYTNKKAVKFKNPTKGGLYKFRIEIQEPPSGAIISSDAWVLLPKAGGEIADWIVSEVPSLVTQASNWANAVRAVAVSNSLDEEEFLDTAWKAIATADFDYQGVVGSPTMRYSFADADRPVDHISNTNIPGMGGARGNGDWDEPSYATLKGIVVHRAKINNAMYAVWGRKLGYTLGELRAGAVWNAMRRDLWDDSTSQNAVSLGGMLYNAYSSGGSLSAVLTKTQAQSIQSPDTPTGLNDVNLWPDPTPVSSGFWLPTMPTDYDSLKDGENTIPRGRLF